MTDDERLTHLLVRRGRLSKERVDEAFRTAKQGSKRLPEVLVEQFGVTPAQIEDAIAVIRAKSLYCLRCAARVHAPAVQEGKEQCPWCLGPLEWKDETSEPQGPDFDSIAELTKEELPPEVRVIRSVPGRRFGKYILLSELGKGGSGIVQKAWDMVLGEYVALKFVRGGGTGTTMVTDLDDEEARREMTLSLLHEARTALRLQHDHIVPIRDLGLVGRQVYISMDYIDGSTLAERLRRSKEGGRLSCFYQDPVLYLMIFRDVCDAIHYAHTFPRPL